MPTEITHKVILQDLKENDGFRAYLINRFYGGIDKIDYLFFLVEAEQHFALFFRQYWPSYEGGMPEFINQIAHTKKEGLVKLHKYALNILEENKKRNTGYDFEDKTSLKYTSLSKPKCTIF